MGGVAGPVQDVSHVDLDSLSAHRARHRPRIRRCRRPVGHVTSFPPHRPFVLRSPGGVISRRGRMAGGKKKSKHERAKRDKKAPTATPPPPVAASDESTDSSAASDESTDSSAASRVDTLT